MQNLEKGQHDLTSIFNTLSETNVFGFCVYLFSSWNKKCCKFNKNAFLLKMGCTTMRNYVKTF